MFKPHYYINGNPKVIADLEKIAQQQCGIETLMTRGRDGLDFHDVGVASLLAALHEAYYKGFNAGMHNVIKDETSTHKK